MSGSGAGVGVVRSWGKTLQPQHVLEAGPGHTLPPVSLGVLITDSFSVTSTF